MTHQSLPRIAEPAVRPRELEILDQIRGIFAEKGFDGASMQELARAAGMSVGNFYRYFPSKAAMVEAMITRDLAEVEEKFACIAAAEDPLCGGEQALTSQPLETLVQDALVLHRLLDCPLGADAVAQNRIFFSAISRCAFEMLRLAHIHRVRG